MPSARKLTSILLNTRNAPMILVASGKGAAAASVLLNRRVDSPSTGLFGLAMFFVCMAIVVFAWLRLRGQGAGR